MRSTLDVERQAEAIRQKHYLRPLFNKTEAYDSLNKFGSFITREGFSELLWKHRFYATENELNMLMDRFDKNKDERISYGEFIDEITPHSPSKY